MAEPALTVRKASCWQPVALDTDGTPLHHGERMVEIRPGVWQDPLAAVIEAFIAAHPIEESPVSTMTVTIPMGCICAYTWHPAHDGRSVRNSPIATCPADHAAIDAAAAA